MTATRWWAPQRADWQIAASFSIGSMCFAVGSIPWYTRWAGATATGVTFFVGSLFFTLAALSQVLISAGVFRADVRPRAGVRWRGRVRTPDRAEWWAGWVQFGGTLMFNFSTASALVEGLSVSEEVRRIWVPDLRGSIAFLLASALVFADVRRPWLRWRIRDLGWTVAMLNMLGSIAFGVSAVGAYIDPNSGDVRNPGAANAGTFVGALCFLAGAILLIPDQADDSVELPPSLADPAAET